MQLWYCEARYTLQHATCSQCSPRDKELKPYITQRGKQGVTDANLFIYTENGISFPSALWNHHDTILNDGVETNNQLESYNSKLVKLTGTRMNVWDVQQTFVKQEADARRTFMTNRMGGDLSANTGRKEKWTDGVAAMKSILEGYETLPKQELITMLAHRQ